MRDSYEDYMDKAARGICPVCDAPYNEHVYPEKVACPDCGLLDNVTSWEAWGHPNGQLECLACFSHPRLPTDAYHTFYKGEDGQTVIVSWTSEPGEQSLPDGW